MLRESQGRNDDFFMGAVIARPNRSPVVKDADGRTLIIPQEMSGDSGAVPWWLGLLIVAGVLGIGYLVLKQEKIL